jgi:hypothetical protein
VALVVGEEALHFSFEVLTAKKPDREVPASLGLAAVEVPALLATHLVQ